MERDLIPGELEPDTEVQLPDPMGSELSTSDPELTLTDEERRERERDGGGAPGQRPRHKGDR
jgi:hypothetical protein